MSNLTATILNDKSLSGDFGKMYPSPSPSPTVFPPTSPKDQDLSTHHLAKKRRKSLVPIKAIPQTIVKHDYTLAKSLGSVIRLDVYHLYLVDPNSLIGSRIVSKKVNSVISVQSCTSNAIQTLPSLVHSQSIDTIYEEEVIPKTTSDRCKPLVSPVSTSDYDNSLYQNTQGAPHVIWKKGSCLTIPTTVEFYDQLTSEEIRTCSTLRVLPDQYLHIKQTILSAAEVRGPFKKRDAKSWFRIDVNKTAVLFDWFRAIGWIPSDEEWERRAKTKGQSVYENSSSD